MPVVDKFQPVDSTAHTITPWAPVWAGCVVLAGVLALFSGDTFEREALYDTSWSDTSRAAFETVAAISEASGLRGLRATLEGWSEPLDETSTWFRATRDAGLPPVPTLPDEPPAEPDEPPGERWARVAKRDVKRRVLIVGASSIQYAVGTELERVLAEDYDVAVLRKGKVSTGLTRPDVFDWPAEVRDLVAEFQPDLVVGQFGGNDGQPIVSPTDGPQQVYTDGWATEYGRRIAGMAKDVQDGGADLILVGMPIMRSDKFTKKIRWLNDITRDAVEGSGGQYVDIFDLAADDKGAYVAEVRFEGQSGRMRMDDGIHFTRLGGQHIAHHLAHRLAQTVVLPPRGAPAPDSDSPAPPPPATAYPLTIPSDRRGPSRALAFVPADVPTEGLPVWYLLHGAWDDWRAWSNHAHEALAQLATDHRMIIVLPDGEPFGYWLDAPAKPDQQLATWFHDELVPWVDHHLPSNGTRAYGGVSMGGHGALSLALDHPERVVAATSMSGAVDLTQSTRPELVELLGPIETNRPAWEAHAVLHRVAQAPRGLDGVDVLISCAKDDPWWYAANVQLHDLFDVHHVPHTWTPHAKGGHLWPLWTRELPDHAAFAAAALHPEAPPAAPPEAGEDD